MKKKNFKIKLNKKIGHELAIGIILILAIFVGAIAVICSKKEIRRLSELEKNFEMHAPVSVAAKKTEKPARQEDKCKSRYYEGETDIYGWADPNLQDGDGIIINIIPEDVESLPIKNISDLKNFTVRLIDPGAVLKKKLDASTKDNLVKFTVRGYAEICEKEPPQVSVEQATIAFKKS